MIRSNALKGLLIRSKESIGFRNATKTKIANAVNPNEIPLTKPLPGFERLNYRDAESVKLFDTKITVLSNGLKVVTEPGMGDYCTVGVGIKAGSRFETHYPLGVSHFLEKLAFNASANFPDRDDTFTMLDEKGALVDCQSTKDTFLYASSCHRESVEDVVRLIADSVQRSVIHAEELEYTRMIVNSENEANIRKPEPESLLIDWAHEAAFKGNTLGFSKYCKNEGTKQIQDKHLFAFMSQFYVPERIVLGGVGVDHDLLVQLGETLFDEAKTIWAQNPQILPKTMPPVDQSTAQYMGGMFKLAKDLSNVGLGLYEFPNLAHVMIGFEGVATTHPDFVAFCVLQSLLGGGGSFSAGGPGKGMYARLYSDVMNRNLWMYNATAFNFSYDDTGLFTVRASAPPEYIRNASAAILDEYFRLVQSEVSPAELHLAKTQLKSHMLMNLEILPVMFEDMVRQVMAHGKRLHPNDYIERIDAIESRDIVRVAERMLLTKPSVAGYGDLKDLPHFEQFDQAVAQKSISCLKP